MHLEAPANATLKTLDGFLRKTWLECCGHLSAFTIGGITYAVATDGPFGNPMGDRNMAVAVANVLKAGTEFRHEYDFGSTTELHLKVVSERQGLTRGQDVHILARNEPPAIVCGECGKPATKVCTECLGEDEGWVCDECAAHHHEDMLLPVVNSPRVGVCAYGG